MLVNYMYEYIYEYHFLIAFPFRELLSHYRKYLINHNSSLHIIISLTRWQASYRVYSISPKRPLTNNGQLGLIFLKKTPLWETDVLR
jgi:hypothetical protein